METHEVDDNKVQALKRALDDFNRFGLSHSDDCLHRDGCEAPCPGGSDCYDRADLAPCDPSECHAAAAENLYVAARDILAALEAAR